MNEHEEEVAPAIPALPPRQQPPPLVVAASTMLERIDAVLASATITQEEEQ